MNIYTDGAYSALKKQGGWAYYIPELRLKVCNYEIDTTNNRMELMAAIKALEFIIDSNIKDKDITIYSDSLYLVNTMNGHYQKKTNKDLWVQLDDLVSNLLTKHISFVHIKGHSGHSENNIVDFFANLISQL